MRLYPEKSKILAIAVLASLSAGQVRAAEMSVSAGFEEIIVTAQRREERLQDVPISVAVQSADQLENAVITNLRDITLLTPGLTVTGTGANIQPVIRGVQSQQTDPGNDPNVSVYLDGVYQANQISNNFELADVRQIEVLKGPQGTLFGRNATGGAIRVFTLGPEFETTGKLSLEYGRFNDITARVPDRSVVGRHAAGSIPCFTRIVTATTRSC
jgi:iron complex outermembrane receptor protein